jgi:hypothetical protein
MDKQVLIFTLERETKNTIRHAEDADGKSPRKLTVTIREAEENYATLLYYW